MAPLRLTETYSPGTKRSSPEIGTDLVIAITFGIIEMPSPARLAPQAADHILLTRANDGRDRRPDAISTQPVDPTLLFKGMRTSQSSSRSRSGCDLLRASSSRMCLNFGVRSCKLANSFEAVHNATAGFGP